MAANYMTFSLALVLILASGSVLVLGGNENDTSTEARVRVSCAALNANFTSDKLANCLNCVTALDSDGIGNGTCKFFVVGPTHSGGGVGEVCLSRPPTGKIVNTFTTPSECQDPTPTLSPLPASSTEGEETTTAEPAPKPAPTTFPPPTNATTSKPTTSVPPTPKPTTVPPTPTPTKPTTPEPTTSESPKPVPTTAGPTRGSSTTPAPVPVSPAGGGFSFGTFVGGIVFTLAVSCLAYVIFKFYKARSVRNYTTLSANLI